LKTNNNYLKEKQMKKTIGYYKCEHTAMSLSLRLMDDFKGIELTRIKNSGFNPGFPVSEYPYELVLISGAKIEDCKKIHGEHFVRFSRDKRYKEKYDLSKSYYRKW
jgi:hypothetical protein